MILALLFTRGISLEKWVSSGLIDREKMIYEEMLKQDKLKKVIWITYGSHDKEVEIYLKNNNLLHKNIKIIKLLVN